MASAIHLFMVTALALTVLPYRGVQGTGTCSLSAIAECQVQSDAPTDRTPSNVLKYCSTGRYTLVSCLDSAIQACSYSSSAIKGGLQGGKAAIEYACSSKRVKEYSVRSQCVDSIQSQNAIIRCNIELKQRSITNNICSSIALYQSCIARNMRTLCSEEAAVFMQGLLTYVMKKALAGQGMRLSALCPGYSSTHHLATRRPSKKNHHHLVTIPATPSSPAMHHLATPGPAVHGAGTCSLSAVRKCTVQSHFPTYRSPSNVLKYCSSGIYKYASCLDTAIHSCPYSSSTIKNGLRGAKEGVEYGCATERVQEYSVLSQCIDSTPSVTAIKRCNSELMQHLLTRERCSVISAFRSCIARNMRTLCSEDAAEFMKGLVSHALEKTLALQGIKLNDLCPDLSPARRLDIVTNPVTNPAPDHRGPGYYKLQAATAAAAGLDGGQQSVMIFGFLLAFLAHYRRE